MSGPYDQPLHNQAPGFYPGPVPGPAPGFFPGPPHGQPIHQPTSAYVTTEVSHGEHVKPSGSTSSSGSYVADHGVHISHSGGPAYGGALYAGHGGGSYETMHSGPRRHGRYRRQVIRLPESIPGCVRQVRHRLLTPEPDVLDRVYIQRQGGDIIEEITEVPTTPPPRIQERTVVEPGGPPQVVRKVIRVPPRSGGYGAYHHGDIGFSHGGPSISNVVNTGSYANLLPSTGSFQHFGNISYSGTVGALPVGGFANSGALPYCAPTGGLTNFGGFSAGLQQPSFGFGVGLQQPSFGFGAGLHQPSYGFGAGLQQPSYGFGAGLHQPSFGFGGFQTQALLPPAPSLPANCFII